MVDVFLDSVVIGFLAERKKQRGSHDDIQVLTKFVPDFDALPTLSKRYAEQVIDRSLKRLGVEQLDMVQFSWWTYEVPGWCEAANWLKELQQAGKIRLIAGTNFNTDAARQILDSGVKLASLQVQYSLLDNRPEKRLIELCQEHDIQLLCYGTVAGGFLSEAWLDEGEPLPPFENRSQVKYRLVIDEFGSWMLFQELLRTLKAIAVACKVIDIVKRHKIVVLEAVPASIDAARKEKRAVHAVGDGTFIVDGRRIDRRKAMDSKLPEGV